MYLLPAQSYMRPTESGRTEAFSKGCTKTTLFIVDFCEVDHVSEDQQKSASLFYLYIDSNSISN